MRVTRAMAQVGTAALAIALVCVTAEAQTTVPSRPINPVFQGTQGEQRSSEIGFDPASRTVTMKLSVQELNVYFIPNLRRNNFAVFENGLPQRSVSVEVEHAPITLAVLIQAGGRSQSLNKALETQAVSLTRPLLDVLGRDDKLAIFTYDDAVHSLIGFVAAHEGWDTSLGSLKAASFSESNFYDAAVRVLDQLRSVPGRKAFLLLTTGIDTFSHATLNDVIKTAEDAQAPIYCLNLGSIAKGSVVDMTRGPLGRINWDELSRELQRLARLSGGRAYERASLVDIATIYDDIMEHLRVRYVLTYVSSAMSEGPRTVQVRLVNPSTGQPLSIVDANGRRVIGRVLAQGAYTPGVGTRALG